jgi:hypothetical protein
LATFGRGDLLRLAAYHAGVKRVIKQVILAVLGRRVRCELCGEVLFTAVPVVGRGRVKLLGAERALVRVDFDSMNRLAFRHVQADRCPAQRPAGPR